MFKIFLFYDNVCFVFIVQYKQLSIINY